MWDSYHQAPKPFYRRLWFIIPVALLAVAMLAGSIAWWRFTSYYREKAAAFDMRKIEEMESASVIYDRSGQVLGRIFIQNRDAVSLQDFPYELIQSVVAKEDARFFQHHGVDYFGMVRAVVNNWRAGHTVEGASTLTQQLARNTYGLMKRDYDRKLIESFLAQEVERNFSKNKILELYLNRVYFGSGFYGAEAAARGYFGKRAKEMNLSECATLAGLLKSPNNLSPWGNREACLQQRNYVLGRLRELKMITREQYEKTLAEDLVVKNRTSLAADSYAIDFIRQQVIAQVGADSAVSEGYRIYTTIDAALQKTAEDKMEQQLDEVERRKGFKGQPYARFDHQWKLRKTEGGPSPDYLQGALVALDNATGGLLALVGGRDFQHSQYNRAMQAVRPAGTAFTPFVFAAAFEKGMFPGTLVEDAVIDNRQVMIGGTTGILGEWGPERVDNRYEGSIPAREALVKGKNAATVRLGMQVGVDPVIKLAKSAGMEDAFRPFPATFLGSSEVTLLDLTLAYTIFPGAGMRPTTPFVIQHIEDKDGKTIYLAKPTKKRVIRETTAYEMHTCLAEVLERGTADSAFTKLGLKKFPLGGKTGTAYDFTDAWFVGYDSAITCGVWVGFDKSRQSIYRGAFSNEIALPIWTAVMNSSFSSYPAKDLAKPRGILKSEICVKSGLLATPKCVEVIPDKNGGESVERRTTYFEIATEAQMPRDSCNVHGDSVRTFVKALPEGQYPRATLAVDVASKTPVVMKGPTVIGDDPYGAVKPLASAEVAPGKEEEPPVEVRRAEAVRPMDQTVDDSAVAIEPPPPLSF